MRVSTIPKNDGFWMPGEFEDVITSYSIHYTKLYDNINMLTYDAPNLVILHNEKSSPISKDNLIIMEYQLMLGAEALNLGTCFLGWVSFAMQSFRAKKSYKLKEIYKTLKIPSDRQISGVFSIGSYNFV